MLDAALNHVALATQPYGCKPQFCAKIAAILANDVLQLYPLEILPDPFVCGGPAHTAGGGARPKPCGGSSWSWRYGVALACISTAPADSTQPRCHATIV